MTCDDRGDIAELPYACHPRVIDVADRVEEQVAGQRPDQLGHLADARRGAAGDAVQVGLDLGDLGGGARRGEVVERRPLLTIGGNPLSLVGADRTYVDLLGVLDCACRTDPETHRFPLGLVRAGSTGTPAVLFHPARGADALLTTWLASLATRTGVQPHQVTTPTTGELVSGASGGSRSPRTRRAGRARV